jgi:DNA-directed RNA polymerase specialized sigma24 family protein
VARLLDPDPGISFPALERLVGVYQFPLFRHLLRNQHVDEERARDLLQAFFHERVMQGKIFARARRERGHLRHFLRRALDTFVISTLRKECAQRRSPANGLPLSLDELPETAAPQAETDADWRFDLDVVREILVHTLERMEAECRAKGALHRWELFRARALDPLLRGLPPVPYEDLVIRLGFKSPAEAHNALATARLMFCRILEEVLEEAGGTTDTVAADIETFRAVLLAAARRGLLDDVDPASSGAGPAG